MDKCWSLCYISYLVKFYFIFLVVFCSSELAEVFFGVWQMITKIYQLLLAMKILSYILGAFHCIAWPETGNLYIHCHSSCLSETAVKIPQLALRCFELKFSRMCPLRMDPSFGGHYGSPLIARRCLRAGCGYWPLAAGKDLPASNVRHFSSEV